MQKADKEVGESIILYPFQACGIQLELSKYCAALSWQSVRSPFFQRLDWCSLQTNPYCSFVQKFCIVLNQDPGVGPDTYQNPVEVDFHSVGFGFQNGTQRKGSETKALANSQGTALTHTPEYYSLYWGGCIASEWRLTLRRGYFMSFLASCLSCLFTDTYSSKQEWALSTCFHGTLSAASWLQLSSVVTIVAHVIACSVSVLLGTVHALPSLKTLFAFSLFSQGFCLSGKWCGDGEGLGFFLFFSFFLSWLVVVSCSLWQRTHYVAVLALLDHALFSVSFSNQATEAT